MMSLRVLPLLGVLLLCCWLAARADVDITIHDNHVLQTVPALFHGTNFCSHWNDSGLTPGALTAFGQMNLHGLLRFPGGVPAEWYDWEHPFASGQTALSPMHAWTLASEGHCEMIFQTNAATDSGGVSKRGVKYQFDSSGAHAAAWVRDAKRRGMRVAFWEIGNEPEMDAPGDVKKKGMQAIYDWYDAKFTEQAKAIKAADPTAKIMGPSSTNTWFWWHEGALEKFLKAHGNKEGDGLVDAVSLHWYPGGGDGAWSDRSGAAQDWTGGMDYIKKTIAQYDTRPLPVYITEWNYGGGNNPSSGRLSNALGCADCVGMFLQTGVSGHTHFVYQHIANGWGMLATKGDALPEDAPTPTYFALALAAHLGNQVLECESSSEPRKRLSVYATKNADGDLQVMLINKESKAKDVNLKFDVYQSDGKAVKVSTLASLTDDPDDKISVYNGEEDVHPETFTLPEPDVITSGATLTQHLDPYSITVLEFPSDKHATVKADLVNLSVTPKNGFEKEKTKVTVSVQARDPEKKLQEVTIDLTPVGGNAKTAMTAANGVYTVDFETPENLTLGQKKLVITAQYPDHAGTATAKFKLRELPMVYAPGILYDFEDGTAQGWSGMNCKAEVSKEQVFGDGKNSFKTSAGKWGANPVSGQVDLSHAKTLKVQFYVEFPAGKKQAWPFFYINGGNTNKCIGPDEKGAINTEKKWVECTIDLSPYAKVRTIGFQVYDAAVVYIDHIWCDAVPQGKVKPGGQ